MSGTPQESVPAAQESPSPPRPTISRRGSGRGWVFAGIGVVIIVVLLVIVGFQYHWFGGKTSGGCTGVTLQGDGANFIAALASKWSAQYASETNNQVNYVAGGAGAGITALTSKSVDFGATDDPLSPAQRGQFTSTVLTLPITGGALAMVYNIPGVPNGLKLSGAVLADIYLGLVVKWNDPAIANNNTGLTLPGDTIQTVHRSDGAGTTFVLTDLLSQDSTAWKNGPGKGISVSFPSAPAQVAIKGNPALLSYVETTPDTIGYVDLTDVLAATTPQTYAAILNPMGNFIVPNVTNTQSAIADQSALTTFPASSGDWWNVTMVNAPGPQDYPLSTFAYFFVYQKVDQGYPSDQLRAQVLVQWLQWTITSGQQYASALSYTPLAGDVLALDTAGIQSMTFNGASIPSCS